MKNIHLTDEILQAFLLKEVQDDTIVEHLTVCPICQEKLESYQDLIMDIQKVEPETFSFDVTNVVMDKIIQYENQKTKKHELIFWGLFIFSLLIILSLSISFLPQLLSIFHSIPFFKTLLIIGTGLAVMLFLFADLSKQYKRKEKKIFENNLQPIL